MLTKKRILLFSAALLCVTALFLGLYWKVGVIAEIYKNTEDLEHFLTEENQEIAEEFSKYDIFFTDESHYTQMSYEQQKLFAEYLVKNLGVRTILLEIGYSEGAYITEYIQGGSKNIFQQNSEKLVYLPEESKTPYIDLIEFYKNLNQELETDDQIRVVGLDVEYNLSTKFNYLRYILASTKPGGTIEVNRSLVPLQNLLRQTSDPDSLSDEDRASCRSLAEQILQSVEQNPEEYEAYFGRDYLNFKIAVRNLSAEAHDIAGREKTLAGNLIDCYEVYRDNKFYGQYGGWHLQGQPSDRDRIDGKMQTFVGRVREQYPPLSDKILTIKKYITNIEYRYSGKSDIIKRKSAYDSDANLIPFPISYLRIGNVKKTPELYQYLLELGYPADLEVPEYIIIGNKSKAA